MDTRTKILTAAEARRIAGPVTLATGCFDVLREESLQELEALAASPLLVAVLPLEGALLGQRARAELVAGLRMVDYVIAASQDEVEELIRALKPERVARLEAAHERVAQGLRELVHRRQGDAAKAC